MSKELESKRKLVVDSFISGYGAGHNDTVEGGYGYIEDKAEEYADEVLQPLPAPEAE